jgi:ketosteroid isomerase-like protein
MSANDPEELPRMFAERANAGDIEGLIALYEDGATLVRADGVPASGAGELRKSLESLLAMTPRILARGSRAVRAGDIALMSSGFHMTLGPHTDDGSGFEGASTEVARRQPDGSWLYAIDDPASAIRFGSNPVST